MEISVVVPVRNEESSIRPLLDSLLSQTLPPAEIVITDGGSTDRTAEIITHYIAQGAPIHLIRKGKTLPGRGRNLAAARAACEWIAFTDGGNRPAADWLAALAARASDASADIVYGGWQPVVDGLFKECAAIAYVPPPRNIDGALIRPRFIASTLMRRDVWEKVGGFPEHLRSAEDLLFMSKIEQAGFKVAYAPAAMVQWSLQPDLRQTFKRFVAYSRNNLRAGLWKQWQAAIFKRYFLLALTALPAIVLDAKWLLVTLLVWVLLLSARATVSLWRNRDCYPAGIARNVIRLLVLIPLIVVLDAAAFVGTWQWLIKDKLHLAGDAARDGNDT